jgi:flagellar hook-associated protein 1 FlgK
MEGTGHTLLTSAEFLALPGVDIEAKYENMTAKNFSISFEVANDPQSISSSGAAGEVGNITVLNNLLDMRHNTHMFTEGEPEDFMESVIATMGSDSQQAAMRKESQGLLMSQVENRRLSFSGVSIDEEMAEMVKHQHAYNASAKMIETLQEVYDVLINGLFT